MYRIILSITILSYYIKSIPIHDYSPLQKVCNEYFS